MYKGTKSHSHSIFYVCNTNFLYCTNTTYCYYYNSKIIIFLYLMKGHALY